MHDSRRASGRNPRDLRGLCQAPQLRHLHRALGKLCEATSVGADLTTLQADLAQREGRETMKRAIGAIVVILMGALQAPAQGEEILDLSAPKVGNVGLIKEKLLVLGSISKDDPDGVSGALYPTKTRTNTSCSL